MKKKTHTTEIKHFVACIVAEGSDSENIYIYFYIWEHVYFKVKLPSKPIHKRSGFAEQKKSTHFR